MRLLAYALGFVALVVAHYVRPDWSGAIAGLLLSCALGALEHWQIRRHRCSSCTNADQHRRPR